LLVQLDRAPGIALRGAFTHLACADDPDPEPSRVQLRHFASVLREAAAKGVRPPLVHVANSAGVIQGTDLAADMPAAVNAVRPGLMLYGALPASHQAERVDLQPVMSFRSRVVALRPVAAGDPVGYGATWRATGRSRIATVPVGYADGIPWSLGSRGVAGVGGVRVDYAGRVSMDSSTLDVGATDVALGDEVVLFGASADGRFLLPVEELADRAGTLSYELLVRVGQRVARVGDPDADGGTTARVEP
jgi:alanine racemase